MTTEIEDNELNTELQELYLKSKKWRSDLEFLDSDLEFLGKLLTRNLSRLVRDGEFGKSSQINEKLVIAKSAQTALHLSILNYMDSLAPFILHYKSDLAFELIETHNQLEQKLEERLQDVNTIKTLVFDLLKQELKNDNCNKQFPIHTIRK